MSYCSDSSKKSLTFAWNVIMHFSLPALKLVLKIPQNQKNAMEIPYKTPQMD